VPLDEPELEPLEEPEPLVEPELEPLDEPEPLEDPLEELPLLDEPPLEDPEPDDPEPDEPLLDDPPQAPPAMSPQELVITSAQTRTCFMVFPPSSRFSRHAAPCQRDRASIDSHETSGYASQRVARHATRCRVGADRRQGIMSYDAALMVEWGTPTPGREGRALEEFFSHAQWWTELKAKGTIGDFRMYGTNTGDMSSSAGFVLVEGSVKQIAEFVASDELRRSLSRVSLVTPHLQVRTLDTGDAMMKRMQIYGNAVKDMKV
jgi:hypothetical protein